MNRLQDEPVLVVDCQTTSPSASCDNLLELGWGIFRNLDSVDKLDQNSTHCLLKQEENSIPYRIKQLTGIEESDLKSAVERSEAWDRLLKDYESVTYVVIHYAQFETRFLSELTDRFHGPEDILENTICTHEIIRRLLPGLPSKSLRAVAGYWGYSFPNYKRTQYHVTATGFIWKKVIQVLRNEYNVKTIDRLFQWIRNTDPNRANDRNYRIDRERRLSLPDQPGIYKMFDQTGRLLYIGKASSLRSRVNSYFQSQSSLSSSKRELVSQIDDFEIEPVDSPLEASLLELEEIKKHEPPYNSKLVNENKRLYYASKDLRTISDFPRTQVYYGPVQSKDYFRNIETIRDWLNKESPSLPPNTNRLDELYNSELFQDGLQYLIEEWNLSRSLTIPELLNFGVQLLDQKRSENNGEAPNTKDEPANNTAVEIGEELEDIITWSTRAIRRGEWLKKISTCKIFWKTTRERSREWNFLELETGSVESITRKDNPNLKDKNRSQKNEKAKFTGEIFDRLRVITTELKRLCSEKKPVRILSCIEPGFQLNGRELSSKLDQF